MKKLLIILFLLNSSLVLSLPHKKKLSFFDQLFTKRPTQNDLLFRVDDNIAINVSQATYLCLFGYAGYNFIAEIKYAYNYYGWNEFFQDITEDNPRTWLIYSFLFLTNTYKVFNAERIIPIIIEDES